MLSFYHASFVDFLYSQSRARVRFSLPGNQRRLEFDIFCVPRAHHRVLAQRCFSIMQRFLHFNMCNLPSSYAFDSEVPGLNTSVDKTFSPTVRYVSRYWAKHLPQAEPVTNDPDDLICELKDFLCNTLLFWIEAMNLIGAKSECSSSLKDVGSWTERVSNNLHSYLRAELSS
jgi:hypothetical protein